MRSQPDDAEDGTERDGDAQALAARARMVNAVGAVVLARGAPPASSTAWRVLVIRRARPPRVHTWTLPGGHVEPGETLAEATRREVLEETGLHVRVLEETEVVELAGEGHAYAIHEHLCLPLDETAPLCPGDDASDARWATAEELPELGVSLEAREVIARAAARLGA